MGKHNSRGVMVGAMSMPESEVGGGGMGWKRKKGKQGKWMKPGGRDV